MTSSAVSDWIIDSGATCHMCNDEDLAVFQSLKSAGDYPG